MSVSSLAAADLARAGTPPPPDCGNGASDAGEQCDDGNADNGDGCSDACQVEPDWQCSPPTPAAPVLDPGFEAGTPNPSWSEASTNFGTPICSEATCGLGGGSGPADGTWWAWFGGWSNSDGKKPLEEASLTQTLLIPETATQLRFDLQIPACESQEGYLEVLIDNVRVFYVDRGSPLCGVPGYTPQSADIAAQADEGPDTLAFHGVTFSNYLEVSSFFVDNVRIPGAASECSALAPIFTDGFESD